MASFLNVRHAIGVASGSDALLLSLHALGLGHKDKVIVPTFTFFATAGAVSRLGATPVFVDIDPNSYNLDLNQVENILKKDQPIKAIIPVHLFGLPVDMQHLGTLAESYGLYLIEDACQAINADIPIGSSSSVRLMKAGTIGHAGCFSFFPSKNLGCFGDGGMVVTNDDDLAGKIRLLRVHGSQPKYFHKEIGYNSRLDTLQAAVLNIKLKYLNDWTYKRRLVASVYNAAFQSAGLQGKVKWPNLCEGHVFHQYVIEIDTRDDLLHYLNDRGIGAAVYYPLPLHLQECYRYLGYSKGSLPVAEHISKKILALPIDPELTQEQITYVVNIISEFINLTE